MQTRASNDRQRETQDPELKSASALGFGQKNSILFYFGFFILFWFVFEF